MTQSSYPTSSGPGGRGGPDVNMSTMVVTPTDRVRWGPIIAGLFSALSALVLLYVLGLAFGVTIWGATDGDRSGYGWGAAIWGILSALIAFFIGGWLAARSAAVRGSRNGLLNGAMVWAVTVPLTLLFGFGGVGVLAWLASSGTSGERVISASVVTQDQAGDRGQVTAVPGTGVDRSDVVRAAWGTLIALLLGLGSAALGGYVGASTRDDEFRTREERTVPPPAV